MTNVDFTFRLVQGTTVTDVQNSGPRLKSAFGAVRVDISERTPGYATVKIFRQDPLVNPIAVPYYLDRLLERRHSWVGLPVGVTSQGSSHRLNLVNAPHVLLGGSTGSGKSGAAHSLLAAAVTSVEGANLILLDPKRTELTAWSSAATCHATESESMVDALEFAVALMEDRYRWMEKHSVRNLWQSPEALSAVGGVVTVFVDECADLLMASKKAAGVPLARLAQKSRAAGIELICATQAPRSDLFTTTNGCETLRSNLNTPIALRCVRSSESDVILGVGMSASGITSSGFDVDLPGLAVGVDGKVFRFPYITDSDVEIVLRGVPAGKSMDELKQLVAHGA